MQHLTIQNIPTDVANALVAEKDRRQSSLDQIVIDLLRKGLSVNTEQPRGNGLAKLAGGWTQEEFEQFEAAVAFVDQLPQS